MSNNGLTQKQERFARFLFDGMSQHDAYIQAGYSAKQSPATIDRHASELANSDKVVTRLDEYNQAAKNASVMSVLERKQRLSEIARAKVVDFVNLDKKGNILAMSLDAANNAAIKEITVSDFEKPYPHTKTTFKLLEPVRAIEELNKMEHIYELPGAILQDIKVIVIREGSKGQDENPTLLPELSTRIEGQAEDS